MISQLQAINHIIKNKDSSLLTTENLSDEYFSDYKAEYNFIKNHLQQYGNIPDIETFLSVFPDFEVLKDVSESSKYLVEKLYEDRNTRYLAKSFNDVRQYLLKDDLDGAVEAYKKIYEGLTEGTGLTSVDILKDTSRYDNYIERTKDYNKYYISTGLPELDDVIGGWDREEEYATVMGRPGNGKSYVLDFFMVAAVEQGLRVGLYSGEMSERKVGYRIDTLISHVPNGSLIHGNEGVANDYKKYIDTLPTRFTGCLKVLTPKMINGPAGVSALRAFIEKEKLDILFVDQHSLLEDDRHARSPVEKAANISRDLKNLQVMKHIPIIAASQQNRTKNEDGTIDRTNVAQSDRISQDSTVIIALEKKDDTLKMHIIKSRDTEFGNTLTYHVDFNKGTFQYIPEGADVTDEQAEDIERKYIMQPTEGEDVI